MRGALAAIPQAIVLVALAAEAAFADEDENLLRDSVRMPSRATVWNLPPQPDRPALPMPHFSQDTILPEPVRFNTIPKTNMLPENLRPRNIENQAVIFNTLVKYNIMPQHLLDAPIAPPQPERLREVALERPYSGSMIFLPKLPPPTMVPRVRPEFEQGTPMPDHRRLLGW